MNTLSEVRQEIEAIKEKLRPLFARMDELSRLEKDIESKLWIEANKVTRDQVEMSSGDDKPTFGDVYTFGNWLKLNSKKRFCEWNERIYFSAEIIRGRMCDSPGRVSELPAA